MSHGSADGGKSPRAPKRSEPDTSFTLGERPSKMAFWQPPRCCTCGQCAREPDEFHPERACLYWPKKAKNQDRDHVVELVKYLIGTVMYCLTV